MTIYWYAEIEIVGILRNQLKKEIKKIREQFLICGPYMFTLGDEMRQRILLILAEAGADGMDVAGITAKTQLSRPAISHHLKILKDTGMITSHKKGTQVYYFIYIQNMLDRLKDLLESVEELVSGIDMEALKEKAPWMVSGKGE
ncbi:MAG: winged helix-turn-helix transcriptional regulator [Treponema sp.]|nr:winged helix-turn-helix transcriptional regulator [Treponema sp.]